MPGGWIDLLELLLFDGNDVATTIEEDRAAGRRPLIERHYVLFMLACHSLSTIPPARKLCSTRVLITGNVPRRSGDQIRARIISMVEVTNTLFGIGLVVGAVILSWAVRRHFLHG